MCDNGKPCKNWKSPSDQAAEKGVRLDSREAAKRAMDTHERIRDMMFWEVVLHEYAQVPVTYQGRRGVAWASRDQYDEPYDPQQAQLFADTEQGVMREE